MKKALILCILLSCSHAFSSSISPLCGIWKANRNKPQKYTDILYIYQVCGTAIKGFTYDEDENGGYCLYRISGTYNTQTKTIDAHCISQIITQNHVPTFYKLKYKTSLFGKRLKGKKTIRKNYLSWVNDNITYKKKKKLKHPSLYKGGYYLKKALEEKLGCGCIKEKEEKQKQEETVRDNRDKERVNKNIKTITSTSSTIKIKLKDGNKVDGDKVSIFLNGTRIYSQVEVKRFYRTLTLNLPDNKKEHKVTFVADNLGNSPPNTANIKIKTGKVSYQLTLNCDLNTNNVILIKKQL